MRAPFVVQQSRVVPVGQDEAFHTTLMIPLTTILRRRYGPIGAAKQVVGQTPNWGTVGASRTLQQKGGGSIREELTRVDAPRSFDYALSQLKGPLGALATHVEGQWTFGPASPGTRITWQWTLHPRSWLTALALPVFAVFWRGYASRALEELADALTPGARRS